MDNFSTTIKNIIDKYKTLSEDRNNINVSTIASEFINPLFSALGWNGDSYQKRFFFVNETVSIIVMNVDSKPMLMQCVHRPYKDIDADFVDKRKSRTKFEQKIIDSAYQEHIRWVIFSDFETLRVFDSYYDKLILKFDSVDEYITKKEKLCYISIDSVRNGWLEQLTNNDGTIVDDIIFPSIPSLLNELRVSLANNIYHNNKNNPIVCDKRGIPKLDEIKSIVQKILDRLIVIRYAEDKFIIETEQLLSIYQNWLKTQIYALPLFEQLRTLFKNFSIMHNSSFFDPSSIPDSIKIDPKLLGLIIQDLYLIRFRNFSINVLGEIYETSLWYKFNYNKEDDKITIIQDSKRYKSAKDYHNERYIVKYISDNTIGKLIEGKTYHDIKDIKVLDTSVGSGSFLIYIYQLFNAFYEKEKKLLEDKRDEILSNLESKNQTIFDVGDEIGSIYRAIEEITFRQHHIIEMHLYGVDINEESIKFASVVLTLQALELNKKQPQFIEQNLKAGNPLISGVRDPRALNPYKEDLKESARLRKLIYFERSEDRQTEIKNDIDKIRVKLNRFLNQSLVNIFENPDEKKPFNWEVEFPEVYDPSVPTKKRGFTVIIGNPPYISYYSQWANNISNNDKWFFSSNYQTAKGKLNTYIMFIENSIKKLAPEGQLGLIVPKTLLSMKTYEKVRQFILEKSCINEIDSLAYNVFTSSSIPNIILFLKLEDDSEKRHNNYLKVCSMNDTEIQILDNTVIKQDSFQSFPDTRFNIYIDDDTYKIISEIRKDSYFLEDIADVKDGINPGPLRKELIVNRKINDKCKPLLQGSNINRYDIEWDGKYIIFDYEYVDKLYCDKRFENSKSYTVLGNEKRFTVPEKILTRQTSNKIIAGYDNNQFYVTNSAHTITITNSKLEHNLDTLYVLGILNSNLMNFYYEKMFKEKEDIFPQIKIGNLKQLPIKKIDLSNNIQRERYENFIANVRKRMEYSHWKRRLQKSFLNLLTQQRVKYIRIGDINVYKNNAYQSRGLIEEELLNNISGIVSEIKVENVEDSLIFSVKIDDNWYSILRWKISNEDFRNFILLSARNSLKNKFHKGIWKPRGIVRKWGNNKGSEIIYKRIILPYFPTNSNLHNVDYNIECISSFIEKIKSISPIINIGEIESKITQMDETLDKMVCEIYGIQHNFSIDN